MIIKHRPQGGTPYFATGLERMPANPKPGDTIKVNAMVEGAQDFDATLHWTLNGRIMDPLKAVHLKSRFSGGEGGQTVFKQYNFKKEPAGPDASGKPYISFALGAFEAYDSIEYWIECRAAAESAQSERFRFEVLKPVAFGAARKIEMVNGTMQIRFEEAEAMQPVLTLYFREGRLHFCHGWKAAGQVSCDPSRMEEEGGFYSYTSKLTGHKAAVKMKPFFLRLTDGNGSVLYESAPGKPYMVLHRGRQCGIRQWDMCLKMENEYFLGFGERFNTFNQKGRHVHNYNIEIFCGQGPAAYLPIPFFLTERRFGIHIDTPYNIDMDMGAGDENRVCFSMDTEGERPGLDYCVYFGEPIQIIRSFARDTGETALPPKWAFGLWMSSNRWNTREEALRQASAMRKHDIPTTVLVLEAWTDECTMYLINEAVYEPLPGEQAHRYEDLSFDGKGKWPDFRDFVETLHSMGLKLVLWQVPVIKEPVGEDYSPQAEKDDCAAWENGYGVMEADGTPHRKPYKWFERCQIPDFTDPGAAAWFLEKRRYLLDIGVDGFKTDGGEFILDDDLRFYNGETGRRMRNLYTSLYLEAFHSFAGPGRVLFSRGGYTGCQRYPVYWAGDQASTFGEMRSILRAGMSLSLCGNAFWSFDIAGFAKDMPGTELYIRSAQMAAFCPVMQYHSEPAGGFFGGKKVINNDRTPWNIADYNGDERALVQFRYLANVRMNLMPYIYREAVYCSSSGEPMMRPLMVDFPDEPAVYGIDSQYMFGRDILAAPILEEGAAGRDVYLPQGEWVDFFTHAVFKGGQTIRYDCGLEAFPVFVRKGAVIPLNLGGDFKIGGSIGNDVASYRNLTFWVTDPAGLPYRFEDELGNDIEIQYEKGGIKTDISGPAHEVFVMCGQSISKFTGA